MDSASIYNKSMLRYKKKSANIEKPKYRADYAMKEDGKRKIVQGQSRGDGWKGDCCSLRPWRILSTGLDSPPIGIEIEEKWKKLGYSPLLVLFLRVSGSPHQSFSRPSYLKRFQLARLRQAMGINKSPTSKKAQPN